MPVTANRNTRLELDIEEDVLARPEWNFRRNAARLTRGATPEAGQSEGVLSVAGQAYILKPLMKESARVVTTGFSGAVIQPADLNLATCIASLNTWRVPTDLNGVTVAADVIPSGVPAFYRSVGAGASWAQILAADAAAFPGPTLPTADVPMDRVIQGRVTYSANQGFSLGFFASNYLTGVDNILTFYFGGVTEYSAPENSQAYAGAGQFALNLRGSGEANLYEKDATQLSGWRLRLAFQWADPQQVSNNFHNISIIPVDRDKILFLTAGSEVAVGSFAFTGSTVAAGVKNPQQNLYLHTQAQTGYTKNSTMTGPGIIRVDIRRELRFPLIIKQNLFPGGGTVVDGSFVPPMQVPEGATIRIVPDGRLMPDTTIELTVFDALTGESLPSDGSFNYTTLHAGVRPYYCTFDLISSDNTQTPVLYGFTAHIDGDIQVRTPVTLFGRAKTVSISGPDLTPDQDSAHIEISNDTSDELFLLRARARIPAQITTTRSDDPGDARTILFKGEVATSPATKKGKSVRTGFAQSGPVRQYPSPFWHTYDADFVGQWARLYDQVNLGLQFFAHDEDAEPDPNTQEKPPWKVTDIIKSLLKTAGVPDTAIDVPDNDLRLWPSAANGDVDLYVMQPGVNCAELLLRLCRDYLGQILLFDPNAGTRGMWRLIDNPQPPYVTKFEFFTASPPAGSTFALDCFGPDTAPIQTTQTWVEPPEANLIFVIGAGGALSNDAGPSSNVAVLVNPASFDFNPANPTADPLSPDYLGRMVPVVWVDAELPTPDAVRYVCRRLYDQVAHGRKWRRWYAPLAIITDLSDTYLNDGTGSRPLRINDVVEVNGDQYLLRSVSPAYRSDKAQMANYEGLLLAEAS